MQISAAARVRGERHLQPPPCSLKIVRQRRRPSSTTLICIRTDLHVSQDVAWLSYLLLQMKKDSILNPSQHDLTWPELIWLDLTWPDLTWPELNWSQLDSSFSYFPFGCSFTKSDWFFQMRPPALVVERDEGKVENRQRWRNANGTDSVAPKSANK